MSSSLIEDAVLRNLQVLAESPQRLSEEPDSKAEPAKRKWSFLRKFLNKPSLIVVNASIETADLFGMFGMVKDMLKQIDLPIPINNVWIAAHALECGAALVTRDRNFLNIPGLRFWENT